MIKGLYSRARRSVEFARAPVKTEIVCPGCGGPTRDAGQGHRPRWTCLRASCPFVWGWKLEFSDPERDTDEPERNRPMVAIPYEYGTRELIFERAVTWPRESL